MRTREEIDELTAQYKTYPKGFYHIVFDNLETGQLFDDDIDYAEGMNTVAICQYHSGILIEIFNLMINHAHFLAYCDGRQALEFFFLAKKRMNAMLIAKGKKPLDGKYFFKLISVSDNNQRVATAVYIARNPYKACQGLTPSGYLWGSNYLMFSDMHKMIQGTPLRDYSKRKQHELLKSRMDLPQEYLVNDAMGFILPHSFVRHENLLSLIGNSSNYCYAVTRNNDANVKIAEGLGETIRLDDNELNYLLWNIAKNQYSVNSVTELGIEDRLRVATTLRKKYNVDSKRICRKLSLPLKTVQELFG